MRGWIWTVGSGVALAALLSVASAAPSPPVPKAPTSPTSTTSLDPKAVTYFETHVRPVLAARCQSCHSAKSPKAQGGLVVDTREGLLRGGASGPAIVPGDPEKSPLIEAIRFTGKIQMPPAGKLPEKEIAALTEWVKMGAPDPRTGSATAAKGRVIDLARERRHWAYQPLRTTPPPTVKNRAWARTPVDRFILAKLEAAKLTPNRIADRRTLIRRATLDLTGLPPTLEEVDAFLNDHAPGAWGQVLDRLLASPAYGERWGRHWLDLARFAESHGFEHDYDRPNAYHYRDFVIQALNEDMPFDQFCRWQLAGDELAPEDPLALKATGFLAAGVHSTQITKSQVEKERYDELDDMLATTGTSMLGLTLGCARCHDHKYDPIPTRDYYRLLSTFTTTVRSDYDVTLNPAEYRAQKSQWEREHAPLVSAQIRYEQEQLPSRLAAWLAERKAALEPTQWYTLDVENPQSSGGATFTQAGDGSVIAGGKNAESDTYTLTATTPLTGIQAIRLEALAQPGLVKNGPGRATNGNFDLTDFRVTAAPLSGGDAVPVKLTDPRATFEQEGLPIRAVLDGDPKSGWAVDPQFGKDHAAAFEIPVPIGFPGGTRFTFTLRFEGNTGHNLGRVRLSLGTAPAPALEGASRPEAVERLLRAGSTLPAAGADRQRLLDWYRNLDPGWRTLNEQVVKHQAAMPQPRLQKMLISSEGVPAVRLHTQGGDFLPETHLLRRGDPNQKGEVMSQGFLQVLTSTPEGARHWQQSPPSGWHTSYRRKALAEWITDPKEGAGQLLARVIVNRLWGHHLGRSIVATPSDFGTQGTRPTHPELLDYLALELMRNGWRLKPLHKLIMSSAVYLQTTATDDTKRRLDPQNTLYSRRTRIRLEAEAIRDSMLAVSGLLDRTQYGPGTLDEAQKRRSIYFTVKRSRLIPSLHVFDAPDALQGLALRPTTTVAPQALLMLNNPQVREYARAFAKRAAPDGYSPQQPDKVVRQVYLLALARLPNAEEARDAATFLTSQSAAYAASATPGSESSTESRLTPEVEALSDFCQVLLGLNEFIYLD